MSRKTASMVFAPSPPRIITAWHLGHWSAWFEDSPQVAYGSNTPVVAVERLFDQWQNERFNRAVSLMRHNPRLTSTVGHTDAPSFVSFTCQRSKVLPINRDGFQLQKSPL